MAAKSRLSEIKAKPFLIHLFMGCTSSSRSRDVINDRGVAPKVTRRCSSRWMDRCRTFQGALPKANQQVVEVVLIGMRKNKSTPTDGQIGFLTASLDFSFSFVAPTSKRALGPSCNIEFGNRRLVVGAIYDTFV